MSLCISVKHLDSTTSPEVIIKSGVFPFSQSLLPKSPVVGVCLKTCMRSCTDFILKVGFLHLTLFFSLSIHFKLTIVPAYSYGNSCKLALLVFFFTLLSNIMPVLVTWQTLIKTLFLVCFIWWLAFPVLLK